MFKKNKWSFTQQNFSAAFLYVWLNYSCAGKSHFIQVAISWACWYVDLNLNPFSRLYFRALYPELSGQVGVWSYVSALSMMDEISSFALRFFPIRQFNAESLQRLFSLFSWLLEFWSWLKLCSYWVWQNLSGMRYSPVRFAASKSVLGGQDDIF